MNHTIAKRAKLNHSVGFAYNDMLQNTYGANIQRREIENKQLTGDPWGISYAPPPPKQVIVPVKRQGVEILFQDLPSAIGATVRSGNDYVKSPHPLSQEAVPISDCGFPIMSQNDPRWGLCSETLILNQRNAGPNGGNTTGWLHDMRH
jgi:hypothetical protein